VTAKCSEINVVVVASPEEDPVEHAVPEQFISSFRGSKLVTEASVHAGA
jgi:adenylyl cyclase-associated protein